MQKTTRKAMRKAAPRRAAAAAAVLGCALALTTAPASAAGPTSAASAGAAAKDAASTTVTIIGAAVAKDDPDGLEVAGTITCSTGGKRQWMDVWAVQGDLEAQGHGRAYVECDGAQHFWVAGLPNVHEGYHWRVGESATIGVRLGDFRTHKDVVLIQQTA
jgi:hypothetical protein